MSHYDFGNFNRDKDFSLYQIGNLRKKIEEKNVQEKLNEEVSEAVVQQKKCDANSLDALGNYGVAFSGLNNKKADVSDLGLTAHDQLKIGKYVNANEQARIEQDMMKYFG